MENRERKRIFGEEMVVLRPERWWSLLFCFGGSILQVTIGPKQTLRNKEGNQSTAKRKLPFKGFFFFLL